MLARRINSRPGGFKLFSYTALTRITVHFASPAITCKDFALQVLVARANKITNAKGTFARVGWFVGITLAALNGGRIRIGIVRHQRA
jgi:hypothetical protein